MSAKAPHFLIETFDPEAPERGVPVGRGETLAEVTAKYAALVAKESAGWLYRVLDAWSGYALVPVGG